ncbi:cytochrome c, class I [Psychromonas sp. CNPT3]|uniref:c-type cytochrome n=1 Tax=Psychromonas sp. CNPT3 TaxID=314282 RepID=UPI0002C04875|nr:c-type cytochrome [Psychromonas sp. CNPT3]AGH82425.1 cytochrome c, class I [Psychromonas sp. CNPT3]
MKKLLIPLFALLSFTSAVQAQGDINAGKEKISTCSACHGADGNSPSNLYPKLAGQHASYLEKQLLQYKNGQRKDAIMNTMATMLSEQDIKDISAYYASQQATEESTTAEIAKQGQKLYMGGDVKRALPACTACHGPRGNGLDLAKFPKLSNQHPAYIAKQLHLFRDKARDNDMNGMMIDIAAKLTDKEITLLSEYIAALH